MDGIGEHHSEWCYLGPEDQKSYVLPHMWTFNQGQTQQGDWTLIIWWGKSTQGRYEDRKETPKKQDSIWCPQCKGNNAETLKWQRPIGEGDQELEKRLVREVLI
jgi:hypothetical protein